MLTRIRIALICSSTYPSLKGIFMINGSSEKSENTSQRSGKTETEKARIFDHGMEMNTKQ